MNKVKATACPPPAFLLENDPDRIIRWDSLQVRQNFELVTAYFRQRLGTSTPLPCIHIFRDDYFTMLSGEHDLITRMVYEAPEAAETMIWAFTHGNPDYLTITFQMDVEDPCMQVINYVAKNKSNDLHELFLRELIKLNRKLNDLYAAWVQSGCPIYRVTLPKPKGNNGERYMSA